TESADLYDAIYSFYDYEGVVEKLHRMIQERKRPGGNSLLDVACGTGKHIHYLKEHYTVEGLDWDENMLAIARERNPGISFHHSDMADFDLGREFDVITCLGSAIGSVKTVPRLRQ